MEIAIVLAALLAISEVLSYIPAVKSNGVFQIVFAALKKIVGKKI